MRISVFGLGYVGCVSLGCLAKQGHKVIGIDSNKNKVDLINKGKATIVEPGIDELIENGFYYQKTIKATSDVQFGINESDVSFICVGTPSGKYGQVDISHVLNVAKQIGNALKTKQEFHVIVIRSTVIPGTCKQVMEIIQDTSGHQCKTAFAVASNPEFLREGTAIDDYFNQFLTVIGTDCDRAFNILNEIYHSTNSKIIRISIEVAEFIKYVNNSYHALKVAFSNEIGNICKNLHIDSHEVMQLFCLDKKLNISEKYFLPGFAYGGSCLPKDLKGLQALAHSMHANVPIIDNIERSNNAHKDSILELILEQGKKKIGFLGISFKAGTDDLRNSPALELIERLLGKGYDVRIYDSYVHLSRLTGRNKEEVENKIPHIGKLIHNNLESVISQSEVLIITYKEKSFSSLIEQYPEKLFIDLARINNNLISQGNYVGICW